jgi:hypothetical protein
MKGILFRECPFDMRAIPFLKPFFDLIQFLFALFLFLIQKKDAKISVFKNYKLDESANRNFFLETSILVELVRYS